MEFKYTQRSLEAASVAGGEGGGGGGRKRGCHVRIVNWPPFSFRQRGRETERERERERGRENNIEKYDTLVSVVRYARCESRGERERERRIRAREAEKRTEKRR